MVTTPPGASPGSKVTASTSSTASRAPRRILRVWTFSTLPNCNPERTRSLSAVSQR